MEAKHLIIENGVLKVQTDLVPLVVTNEEILVDHLLRFDEDALYSMAEVGEIFNWIDGVYHAPAGLEYEVKEEGWKDRCRESNCDGEGACLETCVASYNKEITRFAILSFASPKEEASKDAITVKWDLELDRTTEDQKKIESLQQQIELLRDNINPDYNPELFKKWLSTPDGMNYTKWFFSEDEDGSGYVHVLGRDSETFNFDSFKLGNNAIFKQ